MEGICVVPKRESRPHFRTLPGTHCPQICSSKDIENRSIDAIGVCGVSVDASWEVDSMNSRTDTGIILPQLNVIPCEYTSIPSNGFIKKSFNGPRAGLLLASISSSKPEGGTTDAPGGMAFPHTVRPNEVWESRASTPRQKRDGFNRDESIETYALKIEELEKAKSELQKVAAFMGSVMLAGVSKAMRHVEKSRRHLVNSSFSDSFSFPWKHQQYKEHKNDGSEKLASNLAAKGLDYERSLDVRAAVQCFEEAVKMSPNDLLCLCMAAKQWSDLTFYHDVETERERQVVNLKALEYAERAAMLHPNSPGGHMAVCVAKGRLGLFMDNKTKVKLAKEAQEAAQLAIQVGPDNDVAHHLMGRWHYEMSKLNVVVRTIVRVMYGTQLSSGSKEEALKSYKKAIELAPGRLIHFVEAGRVLVELGQKDEAKEYLEASLKKEIEDINAWQTRFDAEEMLADINNVPWTRPSIVPPNVPTNISGTSLTTAALLGVDDIHHRK